MNEDGKNHLGMKLLESEATSFIKRKATARDGQCFIYCAKQGSNVYMHSSSKVVLSDFLETYFT